MSKYRDRIRVAVHIADIHIGVNTITADEFKYQLYERFIKPISEMAILDLITVNGDISHLSLSFNSKMANVYLWFFDSIVTIAKNKNASIIIIKGTLSHDYDQIDNVKFYASDPDVDIHFIDEPSIVEIKGLRLYCLPDIHVKDKKEEKAIYKYPDKYFDIILGHGHLTETQFIKQESEHSIAKNIIYNSDELLRMCKGYIAFGHIHTYMNIRKRIYYVGSFTRYIHGEEADKGFMIAVYIPESGEYLTERVINDLAFNFNTYNINHNTFEKYDVDDLVKRIEKFIKEYSVNRLCLEITYVNSDENIAKIHILRNYFSKNKIVNKMKFKALSRKEIELLEAHKKEAEDKLGGKKYLVDKSIRFEEKLQRFIEEQYKVKIPLEKLETILMSDNLLSRGDE